MSNDTKSVQISLEFTPNPNTLKYALSERILERGTENYTAREEAEEYSPLAVKLFDLEAIIGVMIGPTFVSITLEKHDNLRELNRQVMTIIKEHLESGETVCTPRERNAADEDEMSQRIREIIDAEIRPAVARDGGDITFESFQDGVVYLHMLGACSGCPSSTATLKMGIERRLKSEFPEIDSVEPVA